MVRLLAFAIIGIALAFAFGFKPEPDKRVLFIGNSFTFGGDIPTQVRNIAGSSTPAVNYHVNMVAYPGITLAEHLEQTEALERIQNGVWDVVVLQDASVMSFRPEWVAQMEHATSVLALAAQRNGVEVIYFAHWAPGALAHDQTAANQTIENTYTRIADRSGGTVAAAGRVWQMAADEGLTGLYSEDGHHSSLKGAYAAALAIAATLNDVDVMTADWAPKSVSEAERQFLRAAAASLSP
ncbi:hypothetical protein L0666_01490 [Octadecabacter sp. CECT 8868]|uniref:DUF4886 domain-containing protein n=1 Tax=Octadecabacter algicola TaxID=2909342 RepID=UPI001F1EA3A7|nr:hypothetical protein [Octadecabacter algicola]MCF2903649.1 hypothetical protein [Octadecabacter algicola]